MYFNLTASLFPCKFSSKTWWVNKIVHSTWMRKEWGKWTPLLLLLLLLIQCAILILFYSSRICIIIVLSWDYWTGVEHSKTKLTWEEKTFEEPVTAVASSGRKACRWEALLLNLQELFCKKNFSFLNHFPFPSLLYFLPHITYTILLAFVIEADDHPRINNKA